MDDIVETTGGEIDILIATHEHWDHLSGFVQARQSFDRLKVGQVWLAWTEDDRDDLTQKIKKEKGLALSALRMGLSQMQLAGDAGGADELGGILEFFGAARGPTTSDALKAVREKVSSSRLRYCRPTDAPVIPAGTSARFYVLGPPHDEKMLRKINPSTRDKETYLALAGFQLFMDGAGSALVDGDSGRPFDRQYEIPFAYAQAAPEMKFFRDHYWRPDDAPAVHAQAMPEAESAREDHRRPDDASADHAQATPETESVRDDDQQPDDTSAGKWRRIDTDWLGGAAELALQLDSLTNNTSLVIAIELPDGDVLLFAADAQVGNWLSWQDLKWTMDGKAVTGPDLLKNAIFYKVGHHGSHNATLRAKGLEQMERLRVAMLPVDRAMAVKKHWNKMPQEELTEALDKQAKDGVLRVDRPKPAAMQNVVEEKLFFEVTF
ncbi:hypothetical protein JQ628_09665 [Bradyrhizobium lablabi]|uniref:hypothetical protein n=1 Tax=Bradyrhizobium lablabi TaxID=722472 RepID=UPI001BAA454D|nr:hypothetical protein [Bradyrhizobium lablabi]MBR1121775.1 hypothetical protein [Bradyrhizobium lablabi]